MAEFATTPPIPYVPIADKAAEVRAAIGLAPDTTGNANLNAILAAGPAASRDAIGANDTYRKMENLIFPEGLVAFWDFSESSAPYKSKFGVGLFPLVNGSGSTVTKVTEGPFGSALVFDGYTDFLKIAAEDVGALNLAKSGETVSVLAWVKRTSLDTDFIAGMWQEDDTDPKRQYGLFLDLPFYGGDNKVCGHISYSGGPTPGYPYSRDYSASIRPVLVEAEYRLVAMTYDGEVIKSYLDGVTDNYTGYTDPQGSLHDKNPYIFDEGLNITSVSDFTVGAVKLTSGMGNFMSGRIGGLAVFDRCLSAADIMKLHKQTKPTGNPIIKFDFASTDYHELTESFAKKFGWESVVGVAATDNSTMGGIQSFESVLLGGFSFLFRSGGAAANLSSPAACYFEHLSGLRFSQMQKVVFRLNNSMANESIRLIVKIGSTWYASNATYSVTGDGRTGSNWSTAEMKEIFLSRAENTWRALTLVKGSTLTLGALIATIIPNGELTGIGFYSPPMTGGSTSTIRIGELMVF